jgi:hypothetical protein
MILLESLIVNGQSLSQIIQLYKQHLSHLDWTCTAAVLSDFQRHLNFGLRPAISLPPLLPAELDHAHATQDTTVWHCK